jgi:hypothetical protein
METQFAKIAQQQFIGRFKRIYTYDKYKEDYLAGESLARYLGLTNDGFLNAIFFPRVSEQIANQHIRPKHLHGDWALQKIKDFYSLKTDVTPYTLEALFIRNSKSYIKSLNMSEEEYFHGGGLIPPVLTDILKRKVSVMYVSQHPKFLDYYKEMPADLKIEYFDDLDILSLSNQSRLSKHIMSAIFDN